VVLRYGRTDAAGAPAPTKSVGRAKPLRRHSPLTVHGMHVAVQWLAARGTEVGRVLGFTDSGASRSVARGRAISRRNPDLVPQLLGRRERSFE
jgi:hypothetical protein